MSDQSNIGEKIKRQEEILDKHFPHNEYRARGKGRWLHDDQNCPRCDFEDKVINCMQEHTDRLLLKLEKDVKNLKRFEYTTHDFDEDEEEGRKYYKVSKFAVLLKEALNLIRKLKSGE